MKRKRPARPLEVLLVGCGRASHAHVRAIRYFEKKGFLTLSGLVDRDTKAMEAVIRTGRRGIQAPFMSTDLDDMLANKSFDIAVIATPPVTHAPLAHKALEAGAHLVVEKPLAMDAAEAEGLVARARELGRVLVMGFKYRYIPGVSELKDFIAGGTLGAVVYGTVTTRWGHDQAYYDQAAWFGSWKAEGGALMNQSIHALDLMAWLMDAEPVAATAVLARQCHEMEAADLVSGTLELRDNRYLLLEGTTNTDPDRHEASFFLRLEKGTVRASFASGKQSVSVLPDGGKDLGRKLLLKAAWNRLKGEGPGLIRELGNPFTFLYADLLDAIREERPPLAPGQAGLESLLQALSLFQAGLEQRRVPYPPEDFSLDKMTGFFD